MEIDYTNDPREVLIHFNPNHDPRNGRFIEKTGGTYTPSEAVKVGHRRIDPNNIYNKKHFDSTIAKGKTITTLSYDPNRTKGADMFYAATDYFDKAQYMALFNKYATRPVVKDGIQIGTEKFLKYSINHAAATDIKVASEDSSAKVFADLFKKDRDFYNFVTDNERMEKHFVDDKYRFKGYREARDILHKMDNPDYTPTEKDVRTIYRMFNYVIPSEGTNTKEAADVKRQRVKFFQEMKKAGYGAILDTNDAIYGGFKARSPVIVFDMTQVVPKEVYETKISDKRVATLALAVRKALGI